MKKNLLVFLLFAATAVLVSFQFYQVFQERKRLAASGTELKAEVGKLNAELNELRIELENKESYLLSKTKRISELEEYIEARSEKPYIKIAYITFDDGPSTLTENLLQVLKKNNVPATFFVIGSEDSDFISYYRNIANEGHVFGNHSFHHDYSNLYASQEKFWKDFELQNDFLSQFTGTPTKLFRFPGGSNNPQPLYHGGGPELLSQLKAGLEDEGYIYHDWNVFPDDVYQSDDIKSSTELFDKMRTQISYRKNVTILLHDHSENATTPAALQQIIDLLKEQGYCILPLSENSIPIHF